MENLNSDYKLFLIQAIVAKTATFTGAAVEIDADENDNMMFIANVGSAAAAVGDTLVLKIQGSPDNVTFSDVGTFPGTVLGNGGGNEVASLSVSRGVNKFFRAVATIAGGTPNFTYAVTALVDATQNGATLNSAPLV